MVLGMVQNFLKGFFVFILCCIMIKETCGGEDGTKEDNSPAILLKKKRKLSSAQQSKSKSPKFKHFSTPNSPYLSSKKEHSSTLLDSTSKKRKIEEAFEVPLGTIEILQNNNHRKNEKMSYPHIVKVFCFSMAMKNEDLDGIFTPTKLSVLRNLQMDPHKTKEKTEKFKAGKPDTILNPKYPSNSSFPFPSPTIRRYVNREALSDLREKEIVFTPHPKDFLPEEVMETPEERIQRKAQQKRDFRALESKRGITPKSLKANIKNEHNIWAKHFSYIKMRKEQCTQKFNPAKKITKTDIEYSFKKLVIDQLEHVTVKGYAVYFSLKTLDIERQDGMGETNLNLMKSGLCPIGADGQPMNYHHLTHHDYATHNVDCIIVLLSDELHTKCSGVFHFGRNTYFSLPRIKVNRLLFNPYRDLFNKKIANYFG